MKVVDSSRRQVVMAVLLGLAAAGAAVRHWAPNPSLARDIGTLLLVLWVPAVGNLVAFVVREVVPRLRPPRGFAEDAPFRAQLRAEIEPVDAAGLAPIAEAGQRNCILVIGDEGFSARTAGPLAQALDGTVELELLRPVLALPRLPPGAAFRLMVGTALIAHGRVLAASSS